MATQASSSTFYATSSSNVGEPTFHVLTAFQLTMSIVISVKLDISNYVLWRSQVVPIIRGYNLGDYIFG
uniref:Retrotransposon Copia-like N-terminal domain-containing protein n=1 Tax=Cannabis sativa TaxID=3483 RepID=A0A803Q0I2_CANSA